MPVLDPNYTQSGIEGISGPFRLDVTARFDDILAGYWQRLVDFSDPARQESILLTQYENTSDLMFSVFQDGVAYSVIAPDAIIEGEIADWSVGVDGSGQMWIDKDGVRLGQAQGVVPSSAARSNTLLGQSNWAEDTDLHGAVLGLDIIQSGDGESGGLLNDGAPITGAFQLDVAVRFDDLELRGDQSVYSAQSAEGSDSLRLTQLGTSNDMLFEVVQGGVTHQLVAEDAIAQGEIRYWSIGVDESGRMWLEQEGAPLGEARIAVPQAVPLSEIEIGGTLAAGTAVDGVVVDLAIATSGGVDPADPDPDPADPDPADPDPVLPDLPTDGPVQIDGAFQVDVTARFDAVMGDSSWQRIFDFGNGPGGDNILLAQYENTTSLTLQLWQEGQVHSVTAEDAIVQGESADWSAGIDPEGRMWIAKDGSLLAEAQGVVPADVERANLLVGQSNWAEDAPLQGEVIGLSITQGALLSDPEDPYDPVDPDPTDPDPSALGRGDMFIVAHQDDDLLFMNPTLDAAIDGNDPVTTVYLTAGDFGLDETYWGAREAGEKDAYAHMAGGSTWTNETVTLDLGDTQVNVASSYLEDQPDVRLYFMRLPDGFDGEGSDTYGFESLESLWDGTIDTAGTVDGSARYSAEQVQATLTALMERHTPERIHIQDHTSEHTDIEHSDHVHAAEFASAALGDYSDGTQVISYQGYITWGFEENVTGQELINAQETFAQYADDDPQVFGSDGALLLPYVEWLQREYTVYEQDHSPSLPPVLPLLDPVGEELDRAALAAQEEEDAVSDDAGLLLI